MNYKQLSDEDRYMYNLLGDLHDKNKKLMEFSYTSKSRHKWIVAELTRYNNGEYNER